MSATLRLYCHGLGDCSLIGLPKPDGQTFWILIDCGLHTSTKGGPERLAAVAADVLAATGGHVDVVVGTHEHWDHLGGFHPASALFAQATVGAVWMPWTEDPTNPTATALDRFKGEAAMALSDAALKLWLDGEPPPEGDSVAVGGWTPGQRARESAERLDPTLGFLFGAKGERVRDAREALRGLAPVTHLKAGEMAPLPPELGVRAYVLAPPADPAAFRVVDDVDETYRFGAAPGRSDLAAALLTGFAAVNGRLAPDQDPLSPFDASAGLALSDALAADADAVRNDQRLAFLSAHYAGPDAEGSDQQWRRIDQDWLGAAADLSLQLDNRTNNTSLVLAFEFVATGRVLLFAADAQIGSWRTWPDVTFAAAPGVTGAELMRRTVFLKVSHHGSVNATRADGGLERMDSPDLVAFVPTDEQMARKVRWTGIPADKLLARLNEKTRGRLIVSDAEWTRTGPVPPALAGGALTAPVRLEKGLWVELEVV